MFGPGEELSPDDVMIGADIALYEAKEQGGDRTEVYRGQAGAVLTWVDRIWTALAENRFVLYGQPIVELGSGQVVRRELLIRMISEDGDVIPPDAFLPTAERFGLVTAIDRWVTDEALRIAAGWRGHLVQPVRRLDRRQAGFWLRSARRSPQGSIQIGWCSK